MDKPVLPPMTPRLTAIAEAVAESVPASGRGAVSIADVGTDHAYVPVYLVLTGVCSAAFAGDIGEGPLKNAVGTITHYGVSGKVTPVLSPGLSNFPVSCAERIVIAGMGGEQIAEIVSSCDWVHREGMGLIVQPMTMQEKCRRMLAAEGFRCVREDYVKEGHRIYTVMTYAYSAPEELDDVTAYVGLAAKSDDPLAREYIQARLSKLRGMYDGLSRSPRCGEEAAACAELIRKLEAL